VEAQAAANIAETPPQDRLCRTGRGVGAPAVRQA